MNAPIAPVTPVSAPATPAPVAPPTGAAPVPPEKAQETAPKVKLPNGEELEFDKLQRLVEKGKGADELVRKHQVTEKKLSELKAAAKKDLKAFLASQDLELTPEEISAAALQIVTEQMEREAMDPKDLRLQELEAREAKRLEEEERISKQREEEQEETERESIRSKFKEEVGKALSESEAFSAMNRAEQAVYVADVARAMTGAYKAGKEIPLSKAIAYVDRQIAAKVERYLDSTDPAALIKRFPKFAEAVRKASVEQVRGKPAEPNTPATPAKKKKADAEQRVSLSDLISNHALNMVRD